jgi:hypothetical protein
MTKEHIMEVNYGILEKKEFLNFTLMNKQVLTKKNTLVTGRRERIMKID